jgi:hypothetical protein
MEADRHDLEILDEIIHSTDRTMPLHGCWLDI